MRITLLALVLAVSGMSGNLQAARPRHPRSHARPSTAGPASPHRARKGEIAKGKHRGPAAKARPAAQAAPGPKGRTAAGEAAPVSPLPPLPATPPTAGPGPLVHLERILPSEVQSAPPAAESPVRANPAPSASTAASAPSLAGMRQVLPPKAVASQDSEDEADEPLPLTSGQVASAEFEPADRASLDLLWPVQTRTISSAWGPRIRTKVVRVRVSKRSRKVLRRFMGTHKGVDLSSPMGKDIFAALDGEVVASGTQKGYGNYVALDHGNGVVTYYAHCNRNFVQVGEIVHRGQKIAEVGRTGNATGPHVHFELRLDGVAQNPLPFMNDMEEIPADMVAQNEAAVPPSTRR